MTARSLLPALAAGAALAAAGTGCGGDGNGAEDTPQRAAPVTLVDPLLRTVVEQAPTDARGAVRYVSSPPYGLEPGDGRRGIGTVVLTPTALLRAQRDGPARDVRDVAFDRVVLLRPASSTGGVDGLGRRSSVVRVNDPATGGDATFAAAEALRRPSGRRPSPTLPTTDAADRMVRPGAADGALVLRSSLRLPVRPRLRVVELPSGVPARVGFRVASIRRSAAGDRLRAWLIGPGGRRALRSAGFGVPAGGGPP